MPRASTYRSSRCRPRGVEISADVLGKDLDDPRFDPVWETVVELGMTVILHPQ